MIAAICLFLAVSGSACTPQQTAAGWSTFDCTYMDLQVASQTAAINAPLYSVQVRLYDVLSNVGWEYREHGKRASSRELLRYDALIRSMVRRGYVEKSDYDRILVLEVRLAHSMR